MCQGQHEGQGLTTLDLTNAREHDEANLKQMKDGYSDVSIW